MPRLDEDLLAHRDLSEIVEHRGVAQLPELLAGHAKVGVRAVVGPVRQLRQRDREGRHPLRMAGRRRIALLDRRDARPDEILEQTADPLRQPPVFHRDGRLGRKRPGKPHVVLVERDHLDADHGGDADARRHAHLAVQELEDADRASLRGLHRNRQHRPRAVAVAAVESGVEPVGRREGMAETSGEVQRRAVARDESGDRGVVERQRRLPELEAHGVVLREDETQHVAVAETGSTR